MDYSALLGAQGIAVPDPLATAGKGLTLADLMNRVETGNVGLETLRQRAGAYADPAVLQALSSALSGGQGGQGGPLDLSAITKYGLAAPGIIEDINKMGIQGATIAKDQAAAAKDRQAVMESNNKLIANIAGFTRDHATPDNLIALVRRQVSLGMDPQGVTALPQLQQGVSASEAFNRATGRDVDPNAEAIRTYAEAVQAAALQPETRYKLPGELAQQSATLVGTQATTAKTQAETANIPFENYIKQFGANTAAYGAQTGRMGLTKVETAPGTADRFATSPTPGGGVQSYPIGQDAGTGVFSGGPSSGGGGPGAGNAPNAPSRMPGPAAGVVRPPAENTNVPGQPGGSPTIATPFGKQPGAIKINEAAAGKVAEMMDTLPPIYSALGRFNQLKQQIESDKMMTGPLFGSEGFKQIAGIVSALPGMPDKLREYVANTQIADATSLSGVFNLMGEGKGTLPRSTAAMEMLISSKPGTQQYREAMLGLTNALIADLTTRAQLVTNFTKKVQAGDVPGAADFPPIAGAPRTIDALTPETARANPGVTVRGPEGTKRSNGSTWELVGP